MSNTKHQHNYLVRLAQMRASGELPTPAGHVSHVVVLHDDHCGALRGGRCNCDPDVRPANRAERRRKEQRGA